MRPAFFGLPDAGAGRKREYAAEDYPSASHCAVRFDLGFPPAAAVSHSTLREGEACVRTCDDDFGVKCGISRGSRHLAEHPV